MPFPPIFRQKFALLDYLTFFFLLIGRWCIHSGSNVCYSGVFSKMPVFRAHYFLWSRTPVAEAFMLPMETARGHGKYWHLQVHQHVKLCPGARWLVITALPLKLRQVVWWLLWPELENSGVGGLGTMSFHKRICPEKKNVERCVLWLTLLIALISKK